MTRKIRINAGDVTATATLNDSPTALAIWNALPISAKVSTWGDEVYFSIPVDGPMTDGVEVVKVGDIAYWPPGRAFCVFFGPTPMSRGSEIRPASAVEVVGRSDGDATEFRRVRSGANVSLETIGSD